jgi:resuscitation-promoting factor RpfA
MAAILQQASSPVHRTRRPQEPAHTPFMSSRPAYLTGRGLLRLALAGAVAVGTPIALAGNADAAPASVWDRVAQCESGGNWNTNTGNGYYGGL